MTLASETPSSAISAITPPRRRKSSGVGTADLLMPRWLSPIVVLLLVISVIVPVGYMLLLSLTPNQNVVFGSISLAALEVRNYVDIWSQAPIASGLIHTLIIAGSAAVASVTVGLLAAYPLTRFTFHGRRPYLYTLIAVQTVPGTTLILPLFAVLSWIQTTLGVTFIGTYWPIIITYMTFGVPLSTWLLVAYMRTVPRDLDEAALVDGCSRLGALRRVIFPIALPAIVVAFVFAFLVGWNDVLFASVFTNSNTQTLAIALQRFASDTASSSLPLYGELMAAAVVSSVPVVVLYLVFQRYLVHGLSAGSMTGI
ncbi:MAG: carbohydrate ABC transporter permease [Actinomycetota bacterium]|nr:carbohydrate ABC transporter permease [Actinomycetota bacterium]